MMMKDISKELAAGVVADWSQKMQMVLAPFAPKVISLDGHAGGNS